MRLTRCLASAAVIGAVMAVTPSSAEAQDEQAPPQPPTETNLVFDREVFNYPGFTRRNPFRPLDAADESGPRYEQLTLGGIMYSEDPAQSLVTLTTGGITVAEDGTVAATEGDAYHARVGDTVGNVTIIEIRRDAIDVQVSEFDELITRTMVFVSRRPGGTP